MSKLIAIAFSDLHINLWAKFNKDNDRTLNHMRVLSIIRKQCLKNNVPGIFCGDMFHKPENIDSELLELVSKSFIRLSKKNWKCYAISGNHDMKHSNTIDKPSTSLIRTLSISHNWLKMVDFNSVDIGTAVLHGIPYLDHNKDLNETIIGLSKKLSKSKPNILLLHTDYPGARDTDGTKIDSVENLNINLLAKFDMTLIGHIHKPQKLGKKVYMVGATHQQRRTDRDCDLGYWEVYDDLSMRFKSLAHLMPRFIDVENEEDIKEDGNYYTIIPKQLEKKVITNNIISPSLSKIRLARKYMRAIGLKDKGKSKLLVNILKEAQDD